ncbi:MAG: hypothetical protein HY897_02015 [Deltaproteobacteria bacterium]|nr:hypothetical protein [Deltaproteobacteria bacterium]
MPAWYCLMVRKGCEASVAGRVVQAFGITDEDVVLSKVNQWYLLVKMERSLKNIERVAEIPDTMFFIGSPDPPDVSEADVDLVREGREGTGEDSFLARHFGEWLWHRLSEQEDRESGVLTRWLFKPRPQKDTFWARHIDRFKAAVDQLFLMAGFAAAMLTFDRADWSFGHITCHASIWRCVVASSWWSISWMVLLALAIGFNFAPVSKRKRLLVAWLVVIAAFLALLAHLSAPDLGIHVTGGQV